MQLTTNKKILLAVTIAIVISVGISQIILLMVYQPWLDYDPEQTNPYNIQTKIKVVLWDSSIEWIDVPLVEFHTETDEETRIHRQIYTFQNSHIGMEQYLSPDNTSLLFAFVSLVFMVDSGAYDAFPEVSAYYIIEDKELSVTNFQRDPKTGNAYYSEVDITPHVNRLDPTKMAQQVTSTITLFNR